MNAIVETMLPFELPAALKTHPSNTAKTIWLYLWVNKNADNEVKTSRQELSNATGINRITVNKEVGNLENLGLLETVGNPAINTGQTFIVKYK